MYFCDFIYRKSLFSNTGNLLLLWFLESRKKEGVQVAKGKELEGLLCVCLLVLCESSCVNELLSECEKNIHTYVEIGTALKVTKRGSVGCATKYLRFEF